MKKKIFLIIALIIVVIIMGITLAIKFWPKGNEKEEIKVINQIEKYGYTLEDNETSLHKNYFDELVDTLKPSKIDEEAYAKLLVQLFVSDFYNLKNKTTKNDVGGTQYVHSAAKDNMILKAKDTIYKYVESNLDGKREQKLPVVSDVKILSIKQDKFEYKGNIDKEAYELKAEWTYAEDLGYETTGSFIIMHENDKLSIVEMD